MTLRDIEIETSLITICDSVYGHRLYTGESKTIPEELMDYKCDYQLVNKIKDYTYVEVYKDE